MNSRLPTRTNLDLRGMDLDSIRCAVCDEEIETEEHVFVHCKIVVDIWKDIFKLWKIPILHLNNLFDVLLPNTQVAMSKLVGEGCPKKIISYVLKNLKNHTQATRDVQVGSNVGFKPIKQVYIHVFNKNGANTCGKKKKAEVSSKEKTLYKAASTSIVDSDIEVEEVFNETADYMASTSLKGGSDSG
ncbi:RNA-directed DNA polymerase, eukaryota, reverse transcriptase zinc-binding domain protein [Tanacetum coccineum]